MAGFVRCHWACNKAEGLSDCWHELLLLFLQADSYKCSHVPKFTRSHLTIWFQSWLICCRFCCRFFTSTLSMKYSLLFMWLFIYYPWFRGKGALREEQSFFHPLSNLFFWVTLNLSGFYKGFHMCRLWANLTQLLNKSLHNLCSNLGCVHTSGLNAHFQFNARIWFFCLPVQMTNVWCQLCEQLTLFKWAACAAQQWRRVLNCVMWVQGDAVSDLFCVYQTQYWKPCSPSLIKKKKKSIQLIGNNLFALRMWPPHGRVLGQMLCWQEIKDSNEQEFFDLPSTAVHTPSPPVLSCVWGRGPSPLSAPPWLWFPLAQPWPGLSPCLAGESNTQWCCIK